MVRYLPEIKVTPRVAQNNKSRRSVDEHTTQHPAAISQKKYKPIEESFGWMTTGV
jgi:hypothetical protein